MGLQTQQQVRRERAASGALNFTEEKLDSRSVSISCAIGNRFQLRFESTDPVVSPKLNSLDDVAQIVWLGVSSKNPTRPTVQPADVERCRAALANLCRSDEGSIALDESFNALIPLAARRSVWRRLQERLNVRLPKFGPSPFASKAAVVLGIILTYAIVIPLAEWSDEAHPLQDPPLLLRMGAAVIVRGGFFVLLIVLVVIFREIGRVILPGFPDGCGTLAELSLFTAIANPQNGNARDWTLDEVREQIRDVVARFDKVPNGLVDMQSKLAP